jgi:hypothetical protein
MVRSAVLGRAVGIGVAPIALVLACARGPAGVDTRTPEPALAAEPEVASAPAFDDALPPHDRDAMPSDPDVGADAALPPSGSAPAPSPDAAALTGTWAGTYFFPMTNATGGTVGSVTFFAELTIDGDKLRGSVIEPNTIGDRTTNELRAKIEGTIGEDGLVRFVKTYDGTGGVDHRVEYVGRLDVVTQQIEGVWKVTGSEGRFVMRRHNRMPELALR